MWVIDFEASGLSKQSYPIEVGLTNGSDEYQCLIKPLPSWTHWDYSAQAVHYIKQPTLISTGTDPVVAGTLNQYLQNDVVYCDSEEWDGFWASCYFPISDRKIGGFLAKLVSLSPFLILTVIW